jgi:amino acid transporter
MFTFTGYDASAHLAEETHDPARRTPWGILTAVGVSAIAGYLLLAAVTLAIEDLPAIARDEHAALAAMQHALGSGAGRAAMGLAIAAMWFCGLSSVTSASRTLYAFARDKGLPFSSAIGRVDTRTRTPLVAIGVATIGPLVLVLATAPLSEFLFDAMAKMATMGLYVSYALPVLLGAIARHRGTWRRRGPFSLRALGIPIAWLAVAWSIFVLAVCAMPPNTLAAKLLLGVIALLVVVWLAIVRARFTGPKIDLATLEADSR